MMIYDLSGVFVIAHELGCVGDAHAADSLLQTELHFALSIETEAVPDLDVCG